GDPSNAFEAQRPARRPRRGSHAAISTLQIAVEIRVEPDAGANSPFRLRPRASPFRITYRWRSPSTVESIRLLRVNRHQASKSAFMFDWLVTTAKRSPGRPRLSAAINSGTRPLENVFSPTSISRLTFIGTAAIPAFVRARPPAEIGARAPIEQGLSADT